MRQLVKSIFLRKVHLEIQVRFRKLDKIHLNQFKEYLIQYYYKHYAVFDHSHDIQQDLYDQLYNRIEKVRNKVVPWLSSVKKLKGSSVLEIGCGTGSSLVAFAEQGATVTGLDIDADSLEVASKRLSLYNLNAELVLGNAKDLGTIFKDRHFDFIIFSATVEHMTLTERLASLKAAQTMLNSGSFLVIVETPNRLWHYDFHTSLLPFYFWLPDELAFQYTHHSKRKNFGDVYSDKSAERFMHFLRRGRGVSYHDFEVAFGGFEKIKVISGMEQFLSFPHLRFITDRLKSRGYYQHKRNLQKIGPPLHEAFYEPWLNLIFSKE